MYRRYRGGNLIGFIIGILCVFIAFAQTMFGLLKVSTPLVIFFSFCLFLVVMAIIAGFKRGFFDDFFVSSEPILRQQDIEPVMPQDMAAAAMYRAGFRPDGNPDVQLADIGLLVYDGMQNPKICRSSAVPTNATHIRPFIVLDMPYLADPGTDGIIRFNLLDGSGKLCFQSRSRYHVKQGKNFITPKTWLPLVDQQLGGTWSLQVSMGYVPHLPSMNLSGWKWAARCVHTLMVTARSMS
jgi:hypothetical protein